MAQSFYEPERFSVRSAVVRWFRCFKYRPVASWTQLVCDWVLLGVIAVGFGMLVVAPFAEELEADTEQTLNVGLLMLGYLGFVLLFMVYIWVVDAAWNRLLTGRPMKRAIPYRIGADEWRSLVVYGVSHAIILCVSMGFYLVFAIAMMIALLAVDGGEASGLAASETMSAQHWMFQLLPFVILLFLMIITNYIGFRLNAGAPLAIKRQKLDVLGGWNATNPFAGRLLVSGVSIIVLTYALILALQLGFVGAVTGVVPDLSNDASTVPSALSLAGFLGFGLLIYYTTFQMLRGVVAEAAMVATARDVASQGKPTPPASSDAPHPAPEAV
ncbi:membrane hypothetical protein [Oceanicaulis sp. 350]|nr:membrane hypothetical protein [Oceanicaulis sp. 350]